MMTVIILLGILGAGGFWMYRQGLASAEKDNLESDLEKLKKINEMDKGHDQATDDLLNKLSNAPSVLHNKDDRNW